MLAALYCIYVSLATLQPDLFGERGARPVRVHVGAARRNRRGRAGKLDHRRSDQPCRHRPGHLLRARRHLVRLLHADRGRRRRRLHRPRLRHHQGHALRDIIDCILSVGRTSAPILLLLVTAQLYSRTLAMTGIANASRTSSSARAAPGMILLVMVLVWFLLGMMIDSISIMLLTAPIFAPIAVSSATTRSPSPSSASWRSRPVC